MTWACRLKIVHSVVVDEHENVVVVWAKKYTCILNKTNNPTSNLVAFVGGNGGCIGGGNGSGVGGGKTFIINSCVSLNIYSPVVVFMTNESEFVLNAK